MASRGRGARAKGANFERSLAKIITESTSIEARRGLAQTRGGGAEVSDVEMPKIHIEAKDKSAAILELHLNKQSMIAK